jgi:hypothetical protein
MVDHIRKGNYGLVEVLAGAHVGQVGSYAHDAQDNHYALVSLHALCSKGPVLIPRHWLRRVDGTPGEPEPEMQDANTMVLALALALS